MSGVYASEKEEERETENVSETRRDSYAWCVMHNCENQTKQQTK